MKISELEFLKDLQQELKTQTNDGNAKPVYWGIKDTEKVEASANDYDNIWIYTDEGGSSKSLDEFIERLLDATHDLDEDEKEHYNIEDIQDLHETGYASLLFHENDLMELLREPTKDLLGCEIYEYYEKEIDILKDDTVFITKSEAIKHLEDNSHHYTEKARTWAMTAWRSPQFEKLINILTDVDWTAVEKYLGEVDTDDSN